jgi:hypothetical protein
MGCHIAGPAINPVQVYRTLPGDVWEFLRLWTGYGADLNRNILDFMRWPQIDLGAHDLNDIQRPKSFHQNSWR